MDADIIDTIHSPGHPDDSVAICHTYIDGDPVVRVTLFIDVANANTCRSDVQ